MTGRRKFTYELLKSLFDEFNVTLLKDYSNEYLTRDTRIIGKCVNCENSFEKKFIKLYENKNFGCEECRNKIKFERLKNTMIDKYGVEYAAQSEDFRNKMKSTILEKYGVEYPIQNKEIKNKIKETNLQRYGTEYGLQSEDVKEKRNETNLRKYGVCNNLHRNDIKEKIKQTCLKKYGTTCSLQNENVKIKIRDTNMKKYGTEYGFQSEFIKEKIKETNIKNHGVAYNLQREDIKEKIKQTNLKKYGVEHISQCPVLYDKVTKNMYKSKEYTFPSGNTIKIQGYEHYAIDELLKQEIEENDIITGCNNVPTIWYYDNNNKKRRHFVDIYIPSQNKCIEVKSTWTAKLHEGNIELKQKYAKELGYLYEIWIYDSKGNIENKII
jgi:hypothetical protein